MNGRAVDRYAGTGVHTGVFLAPYTFTAIVWAALVGWLLWREVLSVQVMAGTGVVVVSHLLILRRAGAGRVYRVST